MDAQQVQDWINLGMVGNSIAMDWYAMTHDRPLPSQSLLSQTIGADLSGMRYPGAMFPQMSVGPSGGTAILVIAAVGLGLFLILR